MSSVRIHTPVARILSAIGPTYLRGAPQGLRGPAGPDPWLDPVQVISAAGPLAINYALGKHVRLTLTGDVTLSVTNWPPMDRIARLTLEIQNTGAFGITWPTVLWPGGLEPTLTASGTDIVILSTTTAGAVVYGFPAGLGLA